jgi:hypothetical protein
MKRLFMVALPLMVALGMALLLVLASAPPAAAYDGQASATMSCTNNTSTMTRTVIIIIKWSAVNKYGEVAEADAQAWGGSPTILLGSDTVSVSPPEAKGTVSMTFSFNYTTPFGNVQWQLYNSGHIAPVHAGQLDAANFPGCPYP